MPKPAEPETVPGVPAKVPLGPTEPAKPEPKAKPAEKAKALPLWRVSLACPTPLLHRELDVEAESTEAAKAIFNEKNGIGGSVHPYNVREVAPGTPPDAPAVPTSVVSDLHTFALQLADELDNAPREFAADRVTRRAFLPHTRATEIAARLRNLAGK